MDLQPGQVGQRLLREPLRPRVGLTKSPAGCASVDPQGRSGTEHRARRSRSVEEARPHMFTTDLALRLDPIYAPISKRFHENPDSSPSLCQGLVQADAPRYGPVSRCSAPGCPPQLWQDPVPKVDHPLIAAQGHRATEGQDPRLRTVHFATGDNRLASASTFRGSDKRVERTGRAFALRRRRTGKSTNQPSLRRSYRLSRKSKRISTARRPGRRSRSLT